MATLDEAPSRDYLEELELELDALAESDVTDAEYERLAELARRRKCREKRQTEPFRRESVTRRWEATRPGFGATPIGKLELDAMEDNHKEWLFRREQDAERGNDDSLPYRLLSKTQKALVDFQHEGPHEPESRWSFESGRAVEHEPAVDVRELLALDAPLDDADPDFPLLNVVDLADVMLNGTTDPEMLVDGLLERGVYHLWYGPKECGKTWLVLWVAKQLLERGERVVWVDKEMGRKFIAGRLIALGALPDDVRERLVYLELPTLGAAKETRAEWARLLDERPPALIVVDAQMEVLADAELNENATADVLKWLGWYFEPARRLGITTLMLDHTGHDEGSRTRGASGKGQAAKVELAFEKKSDFNRTSLGMLKVTRNKNTNAAPIPDAQWFRIGGTDDGFVLERIETQVEGLDAEVKAANDAAARERIQTAALKRLVEDAEAGGTGLTGRQLREQVTGGNEAIRQALAELVEESQLMATPGRNGGTLFRLGPVHVDRFGSPYYVGGRTTNQSPTPDARTSTNQSTNRSTEVSEGGDE